MRPFTKKAAAAKSSTPKKTWVPSFCCAPPTMSAKPIKK